MRQLMFAVFAASALAGCGSVSSPLPAKPADMAPLASPGGASGDEAALYLDVVNGLVEQKRYAAAIAFLDGYAAKKVKLEARYWLLRGNALAGLNREEDARAAYAQLDSTPLAAEGWNGKGRVAAARQEWRIAASNFQEAVRNQPSNPDFLNNLAFADMQFGENDQSAFYLRQALELRPGSSLIRNNLLIALTLAGDQAGAEAILRTVKDAPEREKLRGVIEDAIRDNDLTKDGKS